MGGDVKPPRAKASKGKARIGAAEGVSGLRNLAPTLDQTEGSVGYAKKALDRGLKLAGAKDDDVCDFIRGNE